MIKVVVKWRDENCENKPRRQMTYEISIEDFKKVIKRIEETDDEMWFEFDFVILEKFYRNHYKDNYSNPAVYYNGKKSPQRGNTKPFIQMVLRDAILNQIISD